MRLRYGPWETRTITIPAMTLAPIFGGSTVASAGLTRTDTSGTNGATSPGTFPWRDSARRIITADRARNATSSNHNPAVDGQTFDTTSSQTDTASRTLSQWARVGVSASTTADRVLFGTFYDDFTFNMWLGRVGFNVGDYWLADLYQRPSPFSSGQPKALTPTEWIGLWDRIFPASGYDWRQVDVTGCTVEGLPTIDFQSSSPTPPTITRRQVTSATSARSWWPSNTIESEPATGTFSGSTTLSLPTSTGPLSDLVTGPHFRNLFTGALAPLPSGGIVDQFDLANCFIPMSVNGSAPSAGYFEWLDYSPQWPTGTDPGFDETGGIPPPNAGSQVYHGGQGADRWANVRLTMSWRFTVRWRWVAQVFAPPPPLHQTSRMGVLDAPDQFASGRITTQSSGVQAAML